ncbi:MAG: hypothetical protein JWP57_4128, partial [Spirosoma sp.]|nr:hypothetical protein [Spirosoma sp.]
MKPLFLAVLVLCAPGLPALQAQPLGVQTFAPTSPIIAQFRLKSERFGMPAVAVGTDIYVIGGYIRTGLGASIERIDTETNTVPPVDAQILPR